MSDVAAIRRAIVDALPELTSNFGETPTAGQMYVPPSHLKALRLDCNLVIGGRGVGKSFWAAALRDKTLREQLGPSVAELTAARVSTGFGPAPDIGAYPDRETFTDLLGPQRSPYDVWRAVIARWLSTVTGTVVPKKSWGATVDWVVSNPERFARLLEGANDQLAAGKEPGLIVFDALDLTSSDWGTMDNIVRDLLRVVLRLKAYSMLHGKVFLREDQFGRTITDFPDASKVLATRADISWALHDLHGLLWQRLCNGPKDAGKHLREVYKNVTGKPLLQRSGVWRLPEDARRESQTQKDLFESLAGPWMGRDHRRGVPYVWSVSHLADTRGLASPRSFVAAIREAAEDTSRRYPDHSLPLHYESIKRGVQAASSIRVDEMQEEYAWVPPLMEPLRGVTVPCDADTIAKRWEIRFPEGPHSIATHRLPPQHAKKGWLGILEDLKRLGICERMKDGRVNMPDLYRVGFGLGRRGGVKPVSSLR